MIGLIFATRQEARPFLLLGRAELVAEKPFQRYQSSDMPTAVIMISRMGKVAAAAAATALILEHQATRIINAGACGVLRDLPELPVGQIVRITSAIEGDHEVFGRRPEPVLCHSTLWPDLPMARLVTCDRPVFDLRRRNTCAKLGEVVDMEGAAIARVAHLYQVPCEMLKGITDSAQASERKTLLQNLNVISERIAQLLRQALYAVV
jgi:adenosylhomocysteine nucleosidase